jgi:putative salt-induced outer membrane protein YdiY
MGKTGRVSRWIAMATWVVCGGVGGAEAQIVNTLRTGNGAGPGISGEVGAFFSASGGNTEKNDLTGAARLQWHGALHDLRLLADATRSTSAGVTTEEASLVHLRHNRRIAAAVSTVTFVQHQHDRFQRLRSRFLLGVGLRWDWIRRERLRGSWGVTPMLEVEELRDADSTTDARLSTFLSVIGELDDRTSLDVTAFVQPRVDDPDDLRAVASAALRVAVAGRWTVSVQASLSHDARPAEGVEKTDWKTRTGLSVTL